jgi:uncharacterized protein (TIGR02246 family)
MGRAASPAVAWRAPDRRLLPDDRRDMADATIEDRLAVESTIRNLITRFAHLADEGDLDEYEQVFTADAEWNMPGGERRGRADIRAGAEDRRTTGTTGPGSATRHVITTVSVAFDGDTPTAQSYFLFFGDTTTAPTLRIMGVYRDRFRHEDGRWRLARRDIELG